MEFNYEILAFIGAFVIAFYRAFVAIKNYRASKVKTPQLSSTKILDENLDSKTILVNKDYSVRIPVNMIETTELNDEASLQFQNEENQTYLIGIDEPVKDFVFTHKEFGTYENDISSLKNYEKIQMRSFTMSMKLIKQSKLNLYGNGLMAKYLQFDAHVQEIPFPIAYYLAFIENKGRFYFLIAWTPKGKKEENQTALIQILESFRPYEKQIAIT